ncbi:uncharacterized protein A4U43_C04F21320 [Asparagus officinalis]|uniref:SKP1 component dimerisation domain-containing protein n=1 Tax=Asparagus officinalis TaxID=4686 RepID=A0A5P1F385_ASPOF|nr:SKP1-like protein 5 [Asparagus officinalis]ONK72622.1 uncharacterized protein A4U43_C04F21320 [Asparagus officinalis]
MLRTKDNKLVEMDEGVAKLSKALRRQIEGGFAVDAIPVDVNKKTLEKVRACCNARGRWASWPPEVVKEKMKESFDDELAAETFDFAKRFFMFQAAISLEIIELIDLLGETLAAKMRGKSADELLSMIKKDNELTPEEEEQVLKDLQRIVG